MAACFCLMTIPLAVEASPRGFEESHCGVLVGEVCAGWVQAVGGRLRPSTACAGPVHTVRGAHRPRARPPEIPRVHTRGKPESVADARSTIGRRPLAVER